ncbi:MAG: hypothetical protein HY760_06695 [Nitrospirae bacterium]|nr:hypothetical protein [Nitrospirota bacterium]
MFRSKTLIIAVGFLLLLAVGGGTLYWFFSDRVRIQGALESAEEAVEREDLNGLMALLSPRYQDAYGFNKLLVRRVVQDTFREFDRFEVEAGGAVIAVEGENARVRIPVELRVDWAGQRAYLVGTNAKPAPMEIALRKEGLRWRVVWVDGIK